MRVLAQKQNVPLQQRPLQVAGLRANSAVVAQPPPAGAYRQSTQEAERASRAGADADAHNPGRGNLARTTSDFSRIPVHTSPRPILQTKLVVNSPGDIYEQEAERVAEQVVRTPELRVQRACTCGGSCDGCRKKKQVRTLQMKSDAASSGHIGAPASVNEVLRSPGQPLDSATRAFMEPRFGSDFSQVRVHSDQHASQSASEIHARAYTVGQNIVFADNHFSPASAEGQRLLAHELTHVVQQNHRESAIQRDPDADNNEAWGKLGTTDRQEAPKLLQETDDLGAKLVDEQLLHRNSLRAEWLEKVFTLKAKIMEVDTEDKLIDVENEFAALKQTIDETVAKASNQWSSVERRYLDEDHYLRSQKSTDYDEAAKYIEDYYKGTKRAVGTFVTEDDYSTLKFILDNDTHIWLGALRGARIRVADLRKMLDMVAELRRGDEDADKIVPGWNARVNDEIDHLYQLATNAQAASEAQKIDSRKQGLLADEHNFVELAQELTSVRSDTLAVEPVRKSVLGKAYDFVAGGVEAITGPLVEAANEAVDLLKIAGHFASFERYEPHLTSDMAKAAEQGATTGDLLLGMVTGLIETPWRFLKACEDGDWEAIGKETVNLIMLAKTLKEAPENLKKIKNAAKRIPELLEKTRQSLRVLRARKIAFALKQESRLLPSPRQLGAPVATDTTAPRPVPAEPIKLAAPNRPAVTAHADSSGVTIHEAKPPAVLERVRSNTPPKPDVSPKTAIPPKIGRRIKVEPPPPRAAAEKQIAKPSSEQLKKSSNTQDYTAQPKDAPFAQQRAEHMGDAEDSPEVRAVHERSTPKGKSESPSTATGNFGHNDLPRYLEHFRRTDPVKAAQLQKILDWPKGVPVNKLKFRMLDGRMGIPDGIDITEGEVIELKPNTASRWAQRGPYQAAEYARVLNEMKYGGRTDWKPRLLEYDARALGRQLRDWGVLPDDQ